MTETLDEIRKIESDLRLYCRSRTRNGRLYLSEQEAATAKSMELTLNILNQKYEVERQGQKEKMRAARHSFTRISQ